MWNILQLRQVEVNECLKPGLVQHNRVEDLIPTASSAPCFTPPPLNLAVRVTKILFCDTVLSNDQIHTDISELCLVNSNLDVGEADLHENNLNLYVFKSDVISRMSKCYDAQWLYFLMIIYLLILVNIVLKTIT